MAEADKGGEGSQSGSSSSGGATRTETVYIDADVERIASRYGGKDNAIKRLFRDAKKARDERRVAEERLQEVLNDSVPRDGEVLLKGDEAKAWTEYQKLGKKPDELATTLKEHGELSAKQQKLDRRAVIDKAARAAQYNNADVLEDLIETKKIGLVLRTEKVNGTDVEIPYVQPADANAAPVRLTEYVDQNLAGYKAALLAQSAGGSQNGAGGASDGPRRTPHPEQSTGTRTDSNQPKPAGSIPGLREARVLPSQRGKAE